MAAVKARLCSRNPHKLEELRAALPGWELELLDADGYPPEDALSYVENARAKALFGVGRSEPGVWLVGEDSGIEAMALGGRPGDPLGALGRRRRRTAARELGDADDRRARYVCELVCLTPDGELRGSGILEGALAHDAERR